VTSRPVIHGAGLPLQPDCQKIGTIRMPAAAALASSWSSSVKLNEPFAGSIPPHGMSISTLFRPFALRAVKLAVDHGVPLLSKKSCVAHSVPSHGGADAAVAVDVVSTPVPVSTAAATTAPQSSGIARLRN
jgi:hypothetical protein